MIGLLCLHETEIVDTNITQNNDEISSSFGTRGVLFLNSWSAFLSFPATHSLVLPVPVLLLAVGAENNRHEKVKTDWNFAL
jgi:hypothetical protein